MVGGGRGEMEGEGEGGNEGGWGVLREGRGGEGEHKHGAGIHETSMVVYLYKV